MRFTIPNIISLIRIIIAPIFFVLIISTDVFAIRLACILYGIGALTDFFDGWFARNYYGITPWGKFIDPLADKVLTTSAFIAFVVLDIIPLWMVLIVIIRDFGTTFLRYYADTINKPVVTSLFAKWKTFIQMLFIAYILILMFLRSFDFFAASHLALNNLIYSQLTWFMMLALTALTIWTAVEYVFQNELFGFKAGSKNTSI